MARGRLALALTIALPLTARSTGSVALQPLGASLLTLGSSLLTLTTALQALSAPRLTFGATLRAVVPLPAWLRLPRTSPLPGSALLPAGLATTCALGRSPVPPPPFARAALARPALAGATLAGTTLEAIAAEPGASGLRTRTESPRARADRFGTAVKPEIAFSTKPFEPALATQLGTFDDPAEDPAQNRSGRDFARVRFAVLRRRHAGGGQDGRDGDRRYP